MEAHDPAARGLEVADRAAHRARLLEQPTAQVRDLVRADHPGLRMAATDRVRLLAGQAQCALAWRLPPAPAFPDQRCLDREVDSQAEEELAPVGGGRGENQLRVRRAQACSPRAEAGCLGIRTRK